MSHAKDTDSKFKSDVSSGYFKVFISAILLYYFKWKTTPPPWKKLNVDKILMYIKMIEHL